MTKILQILSIKGRLSQIKNIVIWDFPLKFTNGQTTGPIGPVFFDLVSKCSNIQRLALGKGRNVFDCSVDDFLKLKKCTNLEFFEIDHFHLDCVALSVLENMPNMRSCRMRGFDGTTGPSVLQSIQKSQGLKKIGFWQGKGNILVRDFFGLSGMNLVELILSSCILIGSPEHKQQLKEQEDQSEKEIDDENTKAFEVLQKMPLKHLGLFFTEIPNKHFAQLLEIKTLTSLHVGGCWLLDNELLKKLEKLPLINLSLSRSSTISRNGIAYISKTNISTLRISNCPMIQDHDLEPLVHMDSLTRLDLDNLQNITNVAIKNTLVCCKNVSFIVLLDLSKITDDGIVNFENLSALKNITVKKCINITKKGIEIIPTKNNNIRYRNVGVQTS